MAITIAEKFQIFGASAIPSITRKNGLIDRWRPDGVFLWSSLKPGETSDGEILASIFLFMARVNLNLGLLPGVEEEDWPTLTTEGVSSVLTIWSEIKQLLLNSKTENPEEGEPFIPADVVREITGIDGVLVSLMSSAIKRNDELVRH